MEARTNPGEISRSPSSNEPAAAQRDQARDSRVIAKPRERAALEPVPFSPADRPIHASRGIVQREIDAASLQPH